MKKLLSSRSRMVFVVALLGAAFATTASGAPTDHLYSDYNGTNYDFTGLKETVQTADDDPNPLFEAPSGVGDQLIFSPSSFNASAFNGSVDDSHSTFNATITSTTAAFIDIILIDEGGDYEFFGSASGGTFVTATMGGTVTVTDAVNAGDIGTIFTWGGTGSDFPATYTPGSGTSLFEGSPPTGSFAWSASAVIDIASVITGVKEVELQFNNRLRAFSESGTTADIQKKAVSGPKISVIPEPGTFAMLALGLVGIVARARR